MLHNSRLFVTDDLFWEVFIWHILYCSHLLKITSKAHMIYLLKLWSIRPHRWGGDAQRIFLGWRSMKPFIIMGFMLFLAIWDTVYPKKYAHGFCFAVLCCGYTLTDFPISIRLTSLALWQSNDCPSASKATLMNMDKYFIWIHHERLQNHNKAKHNKTVCIFLGIYCTVALDAPLQSIGFLYNSTKHVLRTLTLTWNTTICKFQMFKWINTLNT